MKKPEEINGKEFYQSLTNPEDKREVVRWIIHDNEKSTEKIEGIFSLSIHDEDWETRLSTMLGAVKLGMNSLIPAILEMDLPRSTSSGLSKEELNIVVGFRNVAIDLLQGTLIPSEPVKLDTPSEKKQYLTRLVGRGTIKNLHDSFLLYTSLTLPVYPIQKWPEKYHPSIKRDGNQFFVGDIELKFIPHYRMFLGTSAISYLRVRVASVPFGTFVSKDPICYDQFILEDSMKNGDQDVVKCTLHEAQNFCEAFSSKHDIKISVPNSETWEIAIRGNNGRFYPWGNSYFTEQWESKSMYGLQHFGNLGGEWTSDSLKDGRAIIKGGDPSGRVATIQAAEKTESHCFRIVLSGILD